jgi:hypothetical protein
MLSNNSISSANFEGIFSAALKRYTEQTGKDLLRDQLAIEIQQCPTPTAVLDVLLRQAEAFQEFRNDGSSLTKCLGAITRGLHAVATSPAISAGVSLVGFSVSMFSTAPLYHSSPGIPTCTTHLRWDWHPSLRAYLPHHPQPPHVSHAIRQQGMSMRATILLSIYSDVLNIS